MLAGVVAAVILMLPGGAMAWHAKQSYNPGAPDFDTPDLEFQNWDAVNAANPGAPALVCASCHTLNTAEGDQATAHIATSSRNFSLIRAFQDVPNTTPSALGCVYCHNTDINGRMKGALSHFQSSGSKHPVGKNFVTGVDTNKEYVSSYGGARATELECLDCHEVTLVNPAGTANAYVSHIYPKPAANPYLLKSVTVIGEYDNFCRICHGTAAAASYKGSGKDIRLGVSVVVGTTPVTRHGDALAAQILEDDLTRLKPTSAGGGDQCRACHDTHYSGKSVLYNDGHEKHKVGASEVADTPIVSTGDTSCTEVCHFPGDDDNYVSAANNNYVNHGHGMASSTYKYSGTTIDFVGGSTVTMGMNCTSCHNSIDSSDTSTGRRRHITNPTAGTLQANYKTKFNLDNIPVQASDTGSVYGNPIWGVCFQCHSSYEAHRTATAGMNLGCQDCHDEHAENSGAGSNSFMIPLTTKPQGTYNTTYGGVTPIRAKAGAEAITYDTPRINPATGVVDSNVQDFFAAGAAGLCDSSECHGAKSKGGVPYTPAATFLASGNHTGGVITTVGYDCANACHTHKDDSGGAWRAQDSCASSAVGCHGTASTLPANAYVQPNGTVFPDRAGKHVEHISRIIALNGTTNANDTSTCNWCHPNGVHSGDAITPAELHTGVATDFKTITGLNDANGLGSAANCSNVDCHYNTTVTMADWYNASLAVTCTYCHQTDVNYVAATNPLPNAHTKHVDEVADGGYNYACTNCHLDNGTNMAHQDGTVAGDVIFTVTAPPWGNDADEVVGGTGTGAVKYGTLAAVNYYTCAGVSCHGDFSGGNTANTPNWFNIGVAGDGRCGSCHGTFATSDPLPVYADGAKGNKHPIHHTTELYGCQVCHYPTTTNGTTITTITNHVNGAYSVDDDAAGATLDSFTYTGTANGTCTVSECHGGVSVNWNRAASPDFTCDACHATTGGVKTGVTDVPNYTRDNTTMSKINDIPITGEYATVGHGLAANGGKACADCHDSAVPHDTTAGLTGAVNPFRLKDLTAGGALNFTCTDNVTGCHVTGLATDLAGISYDQIRSHNATELIALGGNPKYDGAAGGWGFAPACVNCHDPHGDGTNVAMMQRQVYDKAAFNLPTQAPPALPTEQTALVFTDNAAGVGAGSFAEATTFSAICQECHEGTTPGTNTTHSFVDGISATTASHTTATDCTACHSHAGAFTPSGCSSAAVGCHGDGANASWPLDAGSLSTQWPRRNGRHLPHMEALGQRFYTKTAAALTQSEQSYICDICHNDPLGVGGSGHNDASQPAQVGAFLRMWGVTPPTLPGADAGTAATYTAATYTPPNWNAGTAVCNNVDCHNEKVTSTPYEWYGVGQSPCLLCHTKGGTNTATAAHPASGLHNLNATNTTAHDETFGVAGDCADCHIKANIPGHINGVALASGDFTAANVGLNTGVAVGNIGTYTELTAGNSRGTCASTTSMLGTCHSDGGRWAREWNTDANANHRTTQAVTNAVCTVCHGTLNAWNAGMTVNHNLTNINNGTHSNCEQCHVLPNAPYVWTTHHDMLETGVRYVETNSNAATAYAAATGNCNNTCHTNDAPHTMGGSTIWGNLGLAGLGASCTACHGYPPTATGHAAGMTPVNHALLRAGGATVNANVTVVHGECDYCHGVRANGTMDGFVAVNPTTLGGNYTYISGTDHKDGSVTMNGGPGAGYVAASGWCSAAACHGANAAHAMASGAPTAILKNFGPGLCQTCHQTGTNGATIVTYNTTGNHVNPTGATAPVTEQCRACHTGHADGTTGANHLEIRTQYGVSTAVPTMNEQYSSHSYRINFGGTSTAAYPDTEAQKCWGCHDTVGVSEWGANTKTATGSLTYNYGSVSTSNWTTATWSAATQPNFKYKTSAFKSTHSVNFDSGQATLTGTAQIGRYSESVDAVGNIRCTYCHDVHNTRPVGTGETATDVNGTPYLRGNWRGNPYAEDGAPFSTSTYPVPATMRYGAVPRGGTQYSMNGGYFIDQNTTAANTPTGRGWTAIQYGGLCEKCHANNDGVFSAAEINTLDWKTGENLWTSPNGHANSVKDGDGTGARNIFDYTHGRISPVNATGKTTSNKYNQGLKLQSGRGYGYRGTSSSGGGYLPVYQTSTAFQSYNWGASVDAATTQIGYHKFSCSKCHNPHASRLPKLLITNCLDINHNTWDNAKGSANTYYTASEDSTSPYNTDAYWMSAQNCHRASDSTAAKTRTPGWNKVSPWGGSW